MDPQIEQQDLRPPPEPRLPWMMLLAITVNVLLITMVIWGIQSTRDPLREITAAARDSVASVRSASPKAVMAQARTACPSSPLLAAAGAKDGRVAPPADVNGKTEKDIDALLTAGSE